MKLFDPRAALAEIDRKAQVVASGGGTPKSEIQDPTPATSATPATQEGKTDPHVANVADVAAPKRETSKISDPSNRLRTSDMKHGYAVNGHPKTWTGKVVSLDAWRHLSEWERHGPDGRLWCGITKRWIRK